MAASLNRLSFRTPPPRVVLVPDALFFVRVVPVAENATAADVAGQAELALEGMAPFALSQMYHAHHWAPGARFAVVYASYQKRFAAEQIAAWEDSEVVLPVFAAFFNATVEPATTLLLSREDSITAIHWGEGTRIPSQVIVRPCLADTGEIERGAVREELLRELGGTRNVIEINEAPVATRDGGVSGLCFQTGAIKSVYDREELDALDIRDKTELGALRRARARDLFLWRAFITCAAAIALAGLLELVLIGGHFWQRSRLRTVDRQAPVVAEIMRSQALSTRIEELSTKRLRPLEMISFVQSKKPASVLFTRTTTTGLLTLEVEASTNNPADVGVYQNALRQLPQLSRVDVQNQVSRDGVSTFRLVITFKPDAFSGTQS